MNQIAYDRMLKASKRSQKAIDRAMVICLATTLVLVIALYFII